MAQFKTSLMEIIEDYISNLAWEEQLEAIEEVEQDLKQFDFADIKTLKAETQKKLQRNGHCPECGQALESKEDQTYVAFNYSSAETTEYTLYCENCGWEE